MSAGGQRGGSAAPARPVTAGWLLALSLAWLGLWMAQLAPLQVLLPLQVGRITGAGGGGEPHRWLHAVVAFGLVSGAAGIATLVASPLAGAASDATRTRWGQRRPWVAGGALVCAAGLVVLGHQDDLVGAAAAWSITLVGFCAASAALTASVADRVPAGQRGTVSTLVALANAVGIVAGTALVGTVVTGTAAGYALLAGLVAALAAPVVLLREPRALPAPAAAPGAPARGARVRSRWTGALAWELASRLLLNLSNALGTTMLLYFFAFDLHVRAPTAFLVQVVLVYVVVTAAVSAVCGPRSDATGRRRPYVVAAGVLQGAAALLLAGRPSPHVVELAAVLLGAGWGAFMAVDQALVTGVLVDGAARGRALGVLGTAVSVPQNTGPLLAAGVVVLAGGFRPLFEVCAALAVAGGLAALGVRPGGAPERAEGPPAPTRVGAGGPPGPT